MASIVYLPLLLLTSLVDSKVTPDKNEFNIDETNVIDLHCSTDRPDQKVTWSKSVDGQGKYQKIEATTEERYKLFDNNTLRIEDARRVIDEADFICQYGTENATIKVRGKPDFTPFKSKDHQKDVDSFNVVERDVLQLICEVVLRPSFKHDSITFKWFREFDNKSAEEITKLNITTEEEKDSENGVYIKKSLLRLDNVKYGDRALYTCEAQNGGIKGNNTVRVRVKDRLAALYPFLGIVAEVTVLCIIICVYERKRSKPELEESENKSDKSHTKMTQ